eukprot:CCRYP_008141-RA/>CCRYP_008141-RA protein AED:0.29 eAED:0.29 QI:608/1/1/1/0/0/2/425/249
MISDHSISSLANILRKINLENIHEITTMDKCEYTEENEEEEDPHLLTFALCSFPNGRLPSVLVVSSLMACIFSLLSNSICKYFKRETTLHYPNSTIVPGLNLSAGLYSYTVKKQNDRIWDEQNPAELEDSKFCQPYPLNVVPDSYWNSARVFAAISLMLGLVGLVFVSLSTCTKIKQSRWKIICTTFLVATLCQGFQFLMIQSNLCTMMPLSGHEYVIHSECSLAKGAHFSIVALCLLVAHRLWMCTYV